MISLDPAPWPESISKYFAENVVSREAPKFLHSTIQDYTDQIAAVDPNFRYEWIRAVAAIGSLTVRVVVTESLQPAVSEILEKMKDEFAILCQHVLAANSIEQWQSIESNGLILDTNVVGSSSDKLARAYERIFEEYKDKFSAGSDYEPTLRLLADDLAAARAQHDPEALS